MDIAEKIRKLLALATSSNPHEASLAAARAQELILKHNISEEELHTGDVAVESIDREGLGINKKNIPVWQGSLAASICKSFLCRCYTSPGIDIMIVGRKTNREVFRATWFYLRDEIERLADRGWRAHRQAEHFGSYPVTSTKWKRGFYFGAIKTISERLIDAQKQLEIDTTGSAIVLASRIKEVDTWLARVVPGLGRGRRVSISSSTGYQQGVAAGHALNLSGRAPASRRITG